MIAVCLPFPLLLPVIPALRRAQDRPSYARAVANNGERLITPFDKPRPDGTWQRILKPRELLDRLACIIAPPRRHLPRTHGVFAPHAKRRSQVAERAGPPVASTHAPPTPADLAEVTRRALGCPAQATQPPPQPAPTATPGARSWARLIARIVEIDPRRCRHGGATLRRVAFIVERAVLVRILEHLGEPTRAPRAALIRDPPPSRWASARGRTPLAEADQAHPPEPAFDAFILQPPNKCLPRGAERLGLAQSPVEWRAELLAAGLIKFPIDGEIAMLSARLAMPHKDPADRIIAATAIVKGAVLVTADAKLLKWKHALKRHDASQ